MNTLAYNVTGCADNIIANCQFSIIVVPINDHTTINTVLGDHITRSIGINFSYRLQF